jgi:hypothetical protein
VETKERRSGRRVSCYLEATCEVMEGSPPSLLARVVTVMNLSLTGASLATFHYREPGTKLYLKMPNPSGNFWCGRLATVVYTKTLPPTHWLLGCQFSAPLGEDELHTLLGNTPAPERRRFPRYVLKVETARHLAITLKNYDLPATIQDISLEGMCLGIDRPMAKGTQLQVDLANSISGAHCTLMFQALHVRQVGNKWFLGGSFPKKIGSQELLSLLS